MTLDWATAMHALVGAHTAILRDTMRHLVEEGLMPSAKAEEIVRSTAERDFPPAETTGETYDACRAELLAIAQALGSWPDSGRAPPSPHPKHDLP